MHFLHPFSLRNQFDHCSTTHGSSGVRLGELEKLNILMQSKKKLIISGDLFFFDIFQLRSFKHPGLLVPKGNTIYEGQNLIYLHLS